MITRMKKPGWDDTAKTWEVWRRGTMRMLLVVIGAVALVRGGFEGAMPDGDELAAIVMVFGGIYFILAACKPGEQGR